MYGKKTNYDFGLPVPVTGMALAQTAVTGTVVSQEDGQPIIGATVRVRAPAPMP